MRRKKSSKLKSFIVLLVLIGAVFLIYKFLLEGKNSFNIDTSSSFGVPDRSEKKELDNEGHTEEFWTNNKFKW